MKRLTTTLSLFVLALAVTGAHAAKDDMDVTRLTNNLNQLSNDPNLGNYAQAEQARARDAISRLSQAKSKDRPHLQYIAERQVDLARASAQFQVSQIKLNELDREHDQIQLEGSRLDAEQARRELDRARLQFQAAQEEAARLQEQGQASAAAAEQAKAEADQARRLAAAQSKVANAAKREAELAAQAARALRAQQQGGDTSTPAPKKKSKGG
ncbi:DUF4398 domain-containing protein [Dyella sp.]|uniref:DUF4398 domain-containing protein n=1 Tax=Dyella sp. TaxID=1869338 RepID=UPI002ED30BB8